MTSIPDNLYSRLLDSEETKNLDREIYSSGCYYEEAWNLADANALFIANILNYSYSDQKSLQFLILMYFVSILSKDEDTKGKTYRILNTICPNYSDDISEEINLLYKAPFKKELDLRVPAELAAFIIVLVGSMIDHFIVSNNLSFDDVTEKFNGFTDTFAIRLLNKKNPIINLKDMLDEALSD